MQFFLIFFVFRQKKLFFHTQIAMKRSVLLILTFICSCIGSILLADDDLGFGLELEASKKISQNLKVAVTAEARTQECIDFWDRFSVGADVTYRIYKQKNSPWKLSANAGYQFIDRYKPAHLSSSGRNWITSYWTTRHRGFASIKGSYQFLKHWTVSLRERCQYTYTVEGNVARYYANRTDADKNGTRNKDKNVGGTDRQVMRSRLEVSWGRKRSPWEPFVNVEVFNDLKDGFAYDQIRYGIGTDYNLNSRNVIGLSYRYKCVNEADKENKHMVKANYTFKF